MLLSVIIPAYNVEETLGRCVESVLGQGVDDMEVIIIDDGSTDGTGKVCDSYGGREGVTVVHQKNGGLSEARNKGLDVAKGEMITFVDPDDYIAPKTYKELVEMMEKIPRTTFWNIP